MYLYVDVKYVQRLSSRLEQFKKKNDYLWNCRCPLCGDSRSSKSKARGFIYRDKRDSSRLAYRCHNCGSSILFSTLLKQIDEELYKEYKFERFKNPHPTQELLSHSEKQPLRQENVHSLVHAICCHDLPDGHVCKLYLESRRIPPNCWNRLYYTGDYRLLVDDLFHDHRHNLRHDERLIIPYLDKQGNILAVTGRSLGDSGIRYITIRANEHGPKLVFGLDRVNLDQTVYIVEGPLDSLFLSNAVASGDSNLIAVADSLSARKTVLIYDNERRNRENVYQLEKAIGLGHRVCIWPDSIQEKDINAMILAGRTPAEIQGIIDSNIVSGLSALAKLNFWKRIHTPHKRGVLL